MQEILDGLLEAIEDERKAQKHYKMLAEKAEDPLLKKVFEQMVKEEEGHEKLLSSRYEALLKLANK
ncbi:rubrerythrin [Desulfuribacillus stibiiarsenatis]|uniref:Rubrerythrin n=1 Tax=Desulfuribacillus stibiiarsenatis TaxID=1390249 RepID=A0A1E5L8T5_9FIRM|nr:ferritin family protein [Desulfuribacillus stibiiarsenatis]OEH86541.1 rubrerythrin [Desulfuribacillus stibiiarsenatis]